MNKGAVRTAGILVLLATSVHCHEDVPARSYRKISARTVGEKHAPRVVFRGGGMTEEVAPPLDAMTEPRERGSALLRSGATDAAIGELRKAAADGEADALSDLAAALVTKGERGDVKSAVQAISLATRAIDKEPQLAAAHFNLGLALEQLALDTEARKAFEEAARVDSNGEWAREARERAARLRSYELDFDPTSVARYVTATADPGSRAILRPYVPAPRAPSTVRNADARG